MVDMSRAWRMLDNEIGRTPMPAEYSNFNVVVGFVSLSKFTVSVQSDNKPFSRPSIVKKTKDQYY